MPVAHDIADRSRMSKPAVSWRILRRRGWMLLLALLLGALCGRVVSKASASAVSNFQVGSQAQDPYQSSRLALTYARLLPEEPFVRRAVAQRTHLSEAQVDSRLSMTAPPGTAVLLTRFTASTPTLALAAQHALNGALASQGEVAGSRLARFVKPVAAPSLSSSGFSSLKAIALGALAAVLIAISLVVAIERRAPRVDDLFDLSEIVALPVTQLVARSSLVWGKNASPQPRPKEHDDLQGLRLHHDANCREGSDVPVMLPVGRRATRAARSLSARERLVAPPLMRGRGIATPAVLILTRGTRAEELERVCAERSASGYSIVAAALVCFDPFPRSLNRLVPWRT